MSPGVFKIDQFKEKPDLATAQKYVADPKYAWNAGMFLFSAQLMQQEIHGKYKGDVGEIQGIYSS